MIKVMDDKALVFDPPEDNPFQKFSRSFLPQGKRVKDQTFCFDRVFDENTVQSDVYEATTKNLLDSVFDGYNATVFAYGATGCGKTHTITGTIQQPGIIFLTMQELFERISETAEEKVTEISLSYLEIYNETIRDLLVTENNTNKQGLSLREDAQKFVSVTGLSQHKPQNVQEVMDIIVRGNELRTMSPTAANATSSRSHAVLQINISQKDRNGGTEENYNMATLSIIDLAGSERASATKNRGERLLEGANINKSLLALGSCINALCDPRRRSHVPYRDSKLTRLLKFSLGGNCKTVMIVCVSPSSAHFDETQNTLRYANRAKNIQTKVTKNVYNVNRHVKDYLVKIDEQIALINELKAQLKDHEGVAFSKFRKQTDKKDAAVRESIERIRIAYTHCAGERSERIGMMKKLRQIERRISMISSWVNAFTRVCEMEQHQDQKVLDNLSAMFKMAQGMLLELESSRHHYHQRMSKTNWARVIDTALQTGLRQIQEADGLEDGPEADNLRREAELMRGSGEREALSAVAEHDKNSESVVIEVLLKAHFETMATIQTLMSMDEEGAMRAARRILGEIINSCTEVTSHIVKPDAKIAPIDFLPPSRSGTPKRSKMSMSPAKMNGIPTLAPPPSTLASPQPSPMRMSPRRRMIGAGAARKGVQFTPKKKSPKKPSKKSLRWRDEAEEGSMLVDYSRTPQKFQATPDQQLISSPTDALPDVHPNSLPKSLTDFTPDDEDSPLAPPPTTSLDLNPQVAKPVSSRFKSGFLLKKPSPNTTIRIDSPPAPTIPADLGSSSPAEPSPLRDLAISQTNKRSSLPRRISQSPETSKSSPKTWDASASGSESDTGRLSDRENARPNRARAATTSSSDAAATAAGLGSEDVKKLKSVLKHKRASSVNQHGHGLSGTPAMSGPARSAHRRRSPTGSSANLSFLSSPAVGADVSTNSSMLGGANSSGLFSASHARRMVRGSEVRDSISVLSPRTNDSAVAKSGAARKSLGGGAAAGVPFTSSGQSSREGSSERSTSASAPRISSGLAMNGSGNGAGKVAAWR